MTLKLKQYFIGLLILVAITAIVTVIVLNLTFIYPIISHQHNLDVATGLDHPTLFYNYRQIVHYLNFPWIDTLYMPDFPMSDTGEFHFWEVKVIFHALHGIILIFVAFLLGAIKNEKALLPYFNASTNLAFVLFGSISALILINFNFTFYWFHRIFFNNDYWIFNPQTDPVIRALPNELFMIKGLLIVALIFLIGIAIKIFHYKRKARLGSPCS